MIYYHLVLAAALLSSSTGESSVHGPPETVLALVGEDVILPCSFSITARDDFPTVEWSKEGLQPNVIFLYRDGCETYEMKNPAFEYRTSLITKELKNRNISLRISNVQLSDAGKYQCMRLWNNSPWDISTLELVVGAASEPKLSVISTETGGVTLQCEANCWQPEPEIRFLDDHGNEISAEDPKRDQNPSGCYTVRRRVTLQSVTNRVTCRVHQPHISQTRVTEILIPADCLRSCTQITGTAVGGTILILLVFGLAVVFIWKKCHKSAEGQKPPVCRQESDQSTTSTVCERQLRDIADDTGNNTIEQLRREVADLQSKLRERDEILKQQNDPKLRLSPVVCQHSQPTMFCSPSKSSLDIPKTFSPPSDLGPKATNLPIDHNPKPTASTSNPPNSGILPQNKGAKPGISRQNSNPAPDCPTQRKHRNNSSPDIFNCTLSSSSSAITSKKMQGAISRSMSESCARFGPNIPRPQRRHSSSNRFSLLAHLAEETELLVSSEKEPVSKHKV